VRSLLNLAGFETIRASQEILWPLPLGGLANRFLVRLWPFNHFALSNLVIARPAPIRAEEPKVSVVIAARNEAGNIKAIFERVPQMGRETEIVFVEGHSKDDTYAAIEREIASHPSTPSLLLKQPGIGKADAIRTGFERASGEILMILDADLTVPPEDLPRFYEALVSGKGRIHQRRAPRLPDGEGSHAHAELHRQQVLQHGVLVAVGTVHQGYVVRDEGYVQKGL
jgi:glycosyltransferase involved in cell wall biosynthesis